MHLQIFYFTLIFTFIISIIFLGDFYNKFKKRIQLQKEIVSEFDVEIHWHWTLSEYWIIKNQSWIEEFLRLRQNNQTPEITKYSAKTILRKKKFQNWAFRYKIHLQFMLGCIYFAGVLFMGLFFEGLGVIP